MIRFFFAMWFPPPFLRDLDDDLLMDPMMMGKTWAVGGPVPLNGIDDDAKNST